MKESRKVKAYKFFSEGKHFTSPEVKALGLKHGTRYGYFREWERGGKLDHVPSGGGGASGLTSLGNGDAVGGYTEPTTPVEVETPATTAPPPPEIAEDEEDDGEFDTLGEGEERTKATVKLVHTKSRSGKPNYSDGDEDNVAAIPEEVIGSGLRIETTVSLKTLSLFEIAKTIDTKLSLGDFIDDCVEDFFRGRGKDIGLLNIEIAKEV